MADPLQFSFSFRISLSLYITYICARNGGLYCHFLLPLAIFLHFLLICSPFPPFASLPPSPLSGTLPTPMLTTTTAMSSLVCRFAFFTSLLLTRLFSAAVVDSDYNINASQPSTPDRLIFPRAFGVSSPQADNRGTTPTPPLTPSSASTNATSNTWRSPTSPLAVANVKLAVDEEEQHGSRLGLGLGFGKGVLDEDRGLSSLSLNDADASSQLKSDRFLSNDDSEGRYLLVRSPITKAIYQTNVTSPRFKASPRRQLMNRYMKFSP